MMVRTHAVVVDSPVEDKTTNSFGGGRMGMVEISNGVFGVSEIFERLPSLFFTGIAYPLDQVFDMVLADAGVHNVFNFIFGDVADDVGRRGSQLVLVQEGWRVKQREKSFVKYVVDLLPHFWEVEAIG